TQLSDNNSTKDLSLDADTEAQNLLNWKRLLSLTALKPLSTAPSVRDRFLRARLKCTRRTVMERSPWSARGGLKANVSKVTHRLVLV
ncbi:hypothetical protein GOODEAATRI_013780, partial [Goodea atripinnis]